MIDAIGGAARPDADARPMARGERRTAFADMLAQQMEPSPTSLSPKPADTTARPASSELLDALEAFRKAATMTRHERIRRDVLEAMDLTQEAIDALPPTERKLVEEKVTAEVERRLRVVSGTPVTARSSLA